MLMQGRPHGWQTRLAQVDRRGLPVYYIHCPGAASCTGTEYSNGDPVLCVTDTGAFTTSGCGGEPGVNGSGFGVFYDLNWTCYMNYSSQVSNCFNASNKPPINSGSDLTSQYCFDQKTGYKTQHWFHVPTNSYGVTTLETYIDTNNVMGVGFSEIPSSSTRSVVPWGKAPPGEPALQSSTSHVQLFANGSWLHPPYYIGYALRTHTDSYCTESF
jgi:hypothetical protein